MSNDSTSDHPQPGNVFANDNALQVIRNKGKRFPEGSIIVREKLKHRDDKKPKMLAVMIKRGAGFSPEAADWEFLVVDVTKTKVKLQSKKGECLDCHRSQQGNDFVYPLK